MRAELALDALEMALTQEGYAPAIAHHDRGVQYASTKYRKALNAKKISLSMSRKANCWDNAVSESFFSTFKREVGDSFADKNDVAAEVFDFYNFYNQRRRHSSLGYLSPLEYEKSLPQEMRVAS